MSVESTQGRFKEDSGPPNELCPKVRLYFTYDPGYVFDEEGNYNPEVEDFRCGETETDELVMFDGERTVSTENVFGVECPEWQLDSVKAHLVANGFLPIAEPTDARRTFSVELVELIELTYSSTLDTIQLFSSEL
jgi:hypothetical protein